MVDLFGRTWQGSPSCDGLETCTFLNQIVRLTRRISPPTG